MAYNFDNQATMTYGGTTTTSNTVTGTINDSLTGSKRAVLSDYNANDDVTYIISLVNSSSVPQTAVSLSDNLGAYTPVGGTAEVTPLTYIDGSLLYYQNGVLQNNAGLTVTAGPPLTITGITVPANGNVTIVYEADINNAAPLAAASSITNAVTVSGAGLTAPFDLNATITSNDEAVLGILKSINPTVIEENGTVTYTFGITNTGNTAADEALDVTVTDTFDPVLSNLTVTFNGEPWVEGTNYTYEQTTGLFRTIPSQITIPAATYTLNANNEYVVTPGYGELVVSGTV